MRCVGGGGTLKKERGGSSFWPWVISVAPWQDEGVDSGGRM